ncbi:MAG: Rid family hydrolase [Phycisphaerales bacterium]|nr:Rid family hydrolase [Phycisphaerales bacterium]
MSDPSTVRTDAAPPPVGAYPHARVVGDTLYCSGVGPRKAGQDDIPGVTLNAQGKVEAKDIAAQCESCFGNARAVVEAAGFAWTDVVDVLAFLTDMEGDFATYNEVYARWFAGEGNPNPARTTIEISALPTPIAVEIKIVAVRQSAS